MGGSPGIFKKGHCPRFLEPPRETKISSRNPEFEKSKVASTEAIVLSGNLCRIFVVTCGRSQTCRWLRNKNKIC